MHNNGVPPPFAQSVNNGTYNTPPPYGNVTMNMSSVTVPSNVSQYNTQTQPQNSQYFANAYNSVPPASQVHAMLPGSHMMPTGMPQQSRFNQYQPQYSSTPPQRQLQQYTWYRKTKQETWVAYTVPISNYLETQLQCSGLEIVKIAIDNVVTIFDFKKQIAQANGEFFSISRHMGPPRNINIDGDNVATNNRNAECDASGICNSLLNDGVCHSYRHIKERNSRKHPARLIRCKYLDVGCTNHSCKYQHPNPANKEHESVWSTVNCSAEILAKKKSKCYYLCVIPNMQSSKCPSGRSCSNIKCDMQHFSSPKKATITVVTNEAKKKQITSNLTFQQKAFANTVVKIEQVENPGLAEAYSQFKLQLITKLQAEPAEILGWHGTPTANIDKILNEGFDTSKHKRQLYGTGCYFAKDPAVSVGYCQGGNKLILCQIIDHNVSYVKPPNNYYVVPDARGIIPLFVITFS